ncbi:hypothetical protein KYI07_03030 [Macrococcus psychrotolerans]|uniref:Uncharacterized protein n=1 Tax=Macrococcus psychrotolerans TaxID=3039389 RepID=A0AAT9P859_9STAP|nr:MULTISPECIES: hypothetical protein [Macrococcus]QYA33426.1 hypothetical protein KYI10_03035 [Macrococcus sp. 19Msa1099]QYA38243.1 hypothetical protein KYI07_03030 [Macrococcus caseolyticus]QYA76950.1 hypothetical protein KYI12_03030 [Macrococcus caseolyticus]
MNNEIKAHIASYMCFLPSQISQLKPYIDNDIFNDIKTVYPLHSNEIIIREINGKHYTLIPCGNLKHYQFSDVRKLMHKINTLHSIHVEVSVDFTLLSHYLDNELVSMISELIQKKQKKEVIKAETMLYDAAVYHHKAFEIERYFPLSYDKIEHVEEVIGDNERLYIIISQPESALYHVELKHEDMIKIVYQSDTQLATRIAYNNRLLEIDAPVPYAIIYDALSYAKQYRKKPVILTHLNDEACITISGTSSTYIDTLIGLSLPIRFRYDVAAAESVLTEATAGKLLFDESKWFHWIDLGQYWNLTSYYQYILNKLVKSVDEK